LQEIIEESIHYEAEPLLPRAHQLRSLKKLTGQDYFEIVTSWVQNCPEWELNDAKRSILVALCDFHSKLQDLGISHRLVQGDKAQIDSSLPTARSASFGRTRMYWG
jgi:hypothetical protein